MRRSLVGLAIAAILLAAVSVYLYRRRREGFVVGRETGLLCPASPGLAGPIVDQAQQYLLPQNITFLIQGYNYRKTPIIRRDGQLVVPLQTSANHNQMSYVFTIAAPNGAKNHEWQLETTDFVEPVVTDGATGKEIAVKSLRRRYDFNRWLLTP